MNKKTKMYVGVALVAVAAYYFWNKSKKDKTMSAFANASGRKPTKYYLDNKEVSKAEFDKVALGKR